MVILTKKQWQKHKNEIEALKKDISEHNKRIELLDEVVKKLNAIENVELRKLAKKEEISLEDEWFNGAKKSEKKKSD